MLLEAPRPDVTCPLALTTWTTADLVPTPDLFTHSSQLHGQRHVAHVMIHAFRLIEATGWTPARTMACAIVTAPTRSSGGARLRRWPRPWPLGGSTTPEAGVLRAVTLHCKPNHFEPDRADPDWPLIALLKDADGLDRVRLGDLDPSYLRLPESLTMVDFAQRLFDETRDSIPEGQALFPALLDAAGDLTGQRIVVPVGALAV